MAKSTTPDLQAARDDVLRTCSKLLEELCRRAARATGRKKTPTATARYHVMVPVGPGRAQGQERKRTVPEWWSLRTVMEEADGRPAWVAASDAVSRYIRHCAVDLGPLGDAGAHYLWPLFREYAKTCDFAYDQEVAERTTETLLGYLEDDTEEARGLMVLSGFSADHAFHLDDRAVIRPIGEDELFDFGREDDIHSRWTPSPLGIPHQDWWICEVRERAPKGEHSAWNTVHKWPELLAHAFRAFKRGGLKLGMGSIRYSNPFGQFGTSRAPLVNIAQPEFGYHLTTNDVSEFIPFWRSFRELMEREQHYLQLPVRRLRTGGRRGDAEDSLVDYVIGLEALFGTRDERTELGFRFNVRGAVILADTLAARRGQMVVLERLYSLRSAIVHGHPPRGDRLDEALVDAEEALRRIWRWYFDHWREERDNRAGINHIDEELVGPRQPASPNPQVPSGTR